MPTTQPRLDIDTADFGKTSLTVTSGRFIATHGFYGWLTTLLGAILGHMSGGSNGVHLG